MAWDPLGPWDPSRQQIPPPHVLERMHAEARAAAQSASFSPPVPLDPAEEARRREEAERERAERDAVLAAHRAWVMARSEEMADELRGVADRIERFLQASLCGAHVSSSPALASLVESPPAPEAIARWFVDHVKVPPTHPELLVEKRVPLWGWCSERRPGWYFAEGVEGILNFPHGEEHPASFFILTNGELHYNHNHAVGRRFQADALREMARMCQLVNLWTAGADGNEVRADKPNRSQPASDPVDEIIAARRQAGEDVDRHSF